MGQIQKVEITRTCDSCSKAITLIQGEVTPEQLAESAGWITVIKEHLIGDAINPIAKLACSKLCAIALLDNDALELPGKLDFTKVQ